MNRRNVVFVAAGLAAVAIGAGTALRRAREAEEDDGPVAPVDVWSLTFDGLDAGSIALAGWRGRPLLLNFWATWCGPCVVEMPLLDRFAKEQGGAGWRVLALAIDQADPVRRFVAERALRLPVAIAGGVGLDLSRQLGNLAGGLPFTAVFDSSGAAVKRHLGAVSRELLNGWMKSVS